MNHPVHVPPVAGRVPPHDLDAEAAVLSAALLSADAFVEVGGWLRPEHFYSEANALIYKAISALFAVGTPVDIVSVASWLRDREQLSRAGGSSYLAQITDATPAVAHVTAHAEIVIAKSKARAMIAACQRFAAEGYGVEGPVDEWAGAAVAELTALADDGAASEGVRGDDAVRALYDRWQNPDKFPPLRSGIPDLDCLVRGLRRKNLVIVGAHSGIGKSALATSIATNVLLNETREDKRCGVLIFSLEMGAEEYVERMACSLARVDSRKLDEDARAELTDEEGRLLLGAMESIGKPHLVVDDRADITIAQIRTSARKVAARFRREGTPLRLIVIDYAQLVSAGTDTRRRSENREQEVAVVGREAKKMAKELDLAVLLLAQLNDDSAKEKRKPRGKDLRESKALLNDADKVILIHNPTAVARAESYVDDAEPPNPNLADEVDLIVSTHRGGKTGTIRAVYWPAFTKFGPWAQVVLPTGGNG